MSVDFHVRGSQSNLTMKNSSCPIFLLLLCLSFSFKSIDCTSTTTTNNNPSYPYLNTITLNCGSSSNSSFNGVYWIGDVGSGFLPPDSPKTSLPATSKSSNDIPTIPYLTARIFHSDFTFSFPTTSPGFHFIRFHFYPGSYSGVNDISMAVFSVSVGSYALLRNFSPSSFSGALKQAYFSKEFAVDVAEEHALNITFTPSGKNPEAFAFVNGIEIRSLALNPYKNYTSAYSKSAFEKLYNVSVGVDDDQLGYLVGSKTGTVIRTEEDLIYNSVASKFLTGELMYNNARTMGGDDMVNMYNNLTWKFAVDSGFRYLVRLYFCEISREITGVNQRVFNVYINSKMVEKSLDLIALLGKPFVTTYKDYYVSVPQGKGGHQDLWLALHPNVGSNPKFANVILNGIEIVKLSDSDGNLAAHTEPREGNKNKKIKNPLLIAFPSVFGGSLLLLCFFIINRRLNLSSNIVTRISKFQYWSGYDKNMRVLIHSDGCRRFTLAEIRAATENFSDTRVVGVGGFGKVYKGLMSMEHSIDRFTEVAIKRRNPESNQGVREFQNEIELLSTFRHMNLVSLLGFCQEQNELILIYEYIPGGTLCNHLYNTKNPPLSWNQRLKICIGAARGLHYLHTGAKHRAIHRDVKSTNILLDHENLVAKVSDFGLSKVAPIPTATTTTHVSTEVKGTFGYLDPKYYQTKKLTEKSDVYSFGVVLFEVLSARPAVKPLMVVEEDEEEKISLAEWALTCHQNENIDDMLVDPYLRGKIEAECLNTYVEIGVKCLGERPSERPSMADVLSNLEKALQLHEATAATLEEIEDEERRLMVV